LKNRILIYGKDTFTANALTDVLKTIPDVSEVLFSDSLKISSAAKQFEAIVIDEDVNTYKELCRINSCLSVLLTVNKDITGANVVYKPFNFNDFVNLLCGLLLKRSGEKEKAIRMKSFEFFPAQRVFVSLDKKTKVQLTEKETEIILCLWRANPSAVDKNKMLRDVWGYGESITTHTLQTHIYRLRLKLEQLAGEDIISSVDGGYALTI
jgi:DNA-binding winged helix-turn-helix (wHTH) protein